ncbi:MAG: hypothetical protein F6K24_25495 [Okeania sp. SIO2D1]|nr:hypothetical protein [Okeania sp. SIO2D1]
MAHSTDIYIQLRITQSPFNVGVPIELPEFTVEQVLELAHCYSLDWNKTQALKLMEIIGGHPYLVQLALYFLERQEISLKDLLS